jgi:hypothetical protein
VQESKLFVVARGVVRHKLEFIFVHLFLSLNSYLCTLYFFLKLVAPAAKSADSQDPR